MAQDGDSGASGIPTKHMEGSHPIGRQAQFRTRTSGDEIQLAGPASLNSRVRLFGQTVGCGSCHSVYSGFENLLVMSNTQSRLCLTCHIE